MYAWNIFRYLGDICHLISVLILLFRLIFKKTCPGVSLRTHIMYLVVFITRYCNQYMFAPPLYNVVFKIFFLASEIAIIVLVSTKMRGSYDIKHDSMQIQYLLVLALPLAIITAPKRNFYQISYSYSLWVESIAIVPQIILLSRVGSLDGLSIDYILFLSIYRLLYLFNWVYKLVTHTGETRPVVWITGILQSVVYSDFIYEYIMSKLKRRHELLPY